MMTKKKRRKKKAAITENYIDLHIEQYKIPTKKIVVNSVAPER